MGKRKLSEYTIGDCECVATGLSHLVTRNFGLIFNKACGVIPTRNFVSLNPSINELNNSNIRSTSHFAFGHDVFKICETRTQPKGLLARSASVAIKLKWYVLIEEDEWDGTSICFGGKNGYSQNKIEERYFKYKRIIKR